MKYLIKIPHAASVQNTDILYLTRECNSIAKWLCHLYEFQVHFFFITVYTRAMFSSIIKTECMSYHI